MSASRMRRTSRNHIFPTPATGPAQGDQQPLDPPIRAHDPHGRPAYEDVKHHTCVGALWGAERASVSASRMRRTSRNHICPTPATGRAQGDQQPPPRCARAGRAGGASDARAGRAGGEWMLARCSLKWMLARCSMLLDTIGYATGHGRTSQTTGHPRLRVLWGARGCGESL